MIINLFSSACSSLQINGKLSDAWERNPVRFPRPKLHHQLPHVVVPLLGPAIENAYAKLTKTVKHKLDLLMYPFILSSNISDSSRQKGH